MEAKIKFIIIQYLRYQSNIYSQNSFTIHKFTKVNILIFSYFGSVLTQQKMSSNTKRKLVIDCDAGVDDAEAILIALSCDSVEVVAITTIVGNCSVDNATRNVLRILKFCNRLDVSESCLSLCYLIFRMLSL